MKTKLFILSTIFLIFFVEAFPQTQQSKGILPLNECQQKLDWEIVSIHRSMNVEMFDLIDSTGECNNSKSINITGYNVFIAIDEGPKAISANYPPVIYIFLKDNDYWKLFAKTEAKLQPDGGLNYRLDDKNQRIVFETKSGMFGYFPFEWLSFGLSE